MNDTLKQDTNTMLSEIELYFEQIQEYLHYDEEQRLLICVIGSNAQANSQVVSLLEQKLEWPEKLVKNKDSFIQQCDLIGSSQANLKIIQSKLLKTCSAIIWVNASSSPVFSDIDLIALEHLRQTLKEDYILDRLVILCSHLIANSNDESILNLELILKKENIFSKSKSVKLLDLNLDADDTAVLQKLRELQDIILAANEQADLCKTRLRITMSHAENYISTTLNSYHRKIIDSIIVYSPQYTEACLQLNLLEERIEQLHEIANSHKYYDYDYLTGDLFIVYNAEDEDEEELNRCERQADKQQKIIDALYKRLYRIFPSYPNLQKLPKELTPLKPHFAKWSKPLIRIMKLKRKTNQLFDDYFKATLKS